MPRTDCLIAEVSVTTHFEVGNLGVHRSEDAEAVRIALQLLDLVATKDPGYKQDICECLEDSNDELDRHVLAYSSFCKVHCMCRDSKILDKVHH